jgi:dGTPase
VVTVLERRYADFDGLNLTWDTLEGLVKHNGPLTDRLGRPLERFRARGLPKTIADYPRAHDLELWSYPSAEAQVGAIADDIAYDAHDIDDGLRAEMFHVDDLANLPVLGDILREIGTRHLVIEPARQAHELVRRLITRMIEDVIAQSRRHFVEIEPDTVEDVRHAGRPVIGFSEAMTKADRAIKDFLYPKLYRQARIAKIMTEAEGVVRRLYGHFVVTPADLPPEWLAGLDPSNAAGRALRIADYIAGMTDRFAMVEYMRLFGEPPELR